MSFLTFKHIRMCCTGKKVFSEVKNVQKSFFFSPKCTLMRLLYLKKKKKTRPENLLFTNTERKLNSKTDDLEYYLATQASEIAQEKTM